MKRSRSALVFALLLALVATLAFAPAALAENGTGWSGRVTDKTVTYWGLGLVVFFPVLITILSLIQGRLERNKEARKKGLARFE